MQCHYVKFMTLVAAAVLKNKTLKATVEAVHQEIKLWLRQACDQAGGRRDPSRGTKHHNPPAHNLPPSDEEDGMIT